MKPKLLVCALTTLFVVGACTTGIHPMNDSKLLQGNWTCVSATIDGKQLPEETTRLLRLALTATRYTTVEGSDILFDSTYTIAPLQNPKQINMLGTEGDLIGKEALGIYALEGSTLRICYTMPGNARP